MNNNCKNRICENNHSFFERLNYYFGKMMTVRDFKDEQKYFNEKRWLLNRVGIGWGVLCGLKVKPHSEGLAEHVMIEPGFALDQYGNEIKMCDEYDLDLSQAEQSENSDYVYISIQYYECLTEPSPIPVDDCGDYKTECVHNRTRESFKFVVSDTAPEIPPPFDEEIMDPYNCRYDCFRFLQNQVPVIIENCPEREECIRIPLARVKFNAEEPATITPEDIDNNIPFRKVAYSNEMLYQLFHCMQQQLWKVHAAHYDRRRYVPLLAQSIQGLDYVDGKNGSTQKGIQPIRMAVNGQSVWITDQEMTIEGESQINKIICINSVSHSIDEIELAHKSWGIAFDGNYMWVAHHETEEEQPGIVTRINVCDLTQSTIELREKPKEVLFDDDYIWISHDVVETQSDGDYHYLSRINRQTMEVDAASIITPGDKSRSSVRSMTYDGEAIWLIFYADAGYGLVKVSNLKRNIEDVSNDDPINCRGDKPEDITFDGTHLWIAHNKGVSKIDIVTNDVVWTMKNNQVISAVTFDGKYIWAADSNDKLLYKFDICSEPYEGYEMIRWDRERYNISRLCFDGAFIWATASFIVETGTPPRGVIHRILP